MTRALLVTFACVVALVVVAHADGRDRVYKAPLAKLSQAQLRREAAHARRYLRFMRYSRVARHDRAYRHETCKTVQVIRRGLCFYVRQRIRERKAWLGRVERLLTPPLPPHYAQWLCIHSHEGAWDANTGNGYYGGLQMDYSFMRSYGGALLASKGTADRWTPLEQMWVAERAYASGRGFGPWPNTARYCGLL